MEYIQDFMAEQDDNLERCYQDGAFSNTVNAAIQASATGSAAAWFATLDPDSLMHQEVSEIINNLEAADESTEQMNSAAEEKDPSSVMPMEIVPDQAEEIRRLTEQVAELQKYIERLKGNPENIETDSEENNGTDVTDEGQSPSNKRPHLDASSTNA